MHLDKIGKHLRILLSVQSIGTPSSVVSFKGSKMSLNTPRSVLTLIHLWSLSAAEDLGSLGGPGSSARRRPAVEPDLSRPQDRRFLIVI